MRFWDGLKSWLGAVTGRSRMESEMDAELRGEHASSLAGSSVPKRNAGRRGP